MQVSLNMTWRTQSLRPCESDLFSFRSSLQPASILRHPDASFSQFKPLSQLSNRHGSLLRLRRRFLSFCKGALLLDHFQYLAMQVGMKVSLNMTWRNQSLRPGETDLFFTIRISSQTASILTTPCPAGAARCPFHSLSSDTLMPVQSVQATQLLEGRFASEFSQCGRPWALVIGVQRLEDIFSIMSTDLRAWRGSEGRWRKCGTTYVER